MSHFSCIERGEFAPNAATMLKIARALGTTPEFLETGRDSRPISARGRS